MIKPNLLYNDQPIIRIVKIAIPAFVILSSLTVFIGVYSYVSEYLESISVTKRIVSYGISYGLFSLTPDVLNVTILAYLVRSILNGFYKDLSSWILLISSLMVCVGLTHYSYEMSKTAALSMANEMVVDQGNHHLTFLDTIQLAKEIQIQNEYEQAKLRVDKNIEQHLANNLAYYDKLIELEQNKIKSWEARRGTENTAYIDTRIRRIKNKIVSLEAEQLQEEMRVRNDQTTRLDSLASERSIRQVELLGLYEQDRKTARQIDDERRNKSQVLLTSFEKEFSWIAGKAVFIILILTMIREILYHRNGIVSSTKVESSGTFTTACKEILLLPFAILFRYTINKVRRIYRNLPALENPVNYPIFNENREVISSNENAFSEPGDSTNSIRQRNEPYDNRIYDTSNVRICQHCKKEYAYRHHKQKYCSDDCRKSAWEQRNGRKLKLKPKKK